MARVLIVDGGERGLRLAARLSEDGHVVRLVTHDEAHRPAIEALGAECVVGTPERLATLSGALEHVTIACWLMASAEGDEETLAALHGPRLEQFLLRTVDSTVRGFVYETGGSSPSQALLLAQGERTVGDIAARNALPVAFVRNDASETAAWLDEAEGAIGRLLAGALS